MAIYAVTVVLSACLLFLVQPLITKMIFPWFGGTSAVWITALMFFQLCLLGGYGYAHVLITKASPQAQRWLHIASLVAACGFMPILLSPQWRPDASDDPTLRICLLLGANVGWPCVVLSATSPLLQGWYVRARRAEIPLWLFALSNFGSLAALLSFPLLLEPAFTSDTLALTWSAGFLVFAGLCAYISWHAPQQTARAESLRTTDAPSIGQMALWVAFCACASALLAAATVQLSTNIAPIPLLWVVPLSLYLLTFILAFSHRRFYRRNLFLPLVAIALAVLAWLYMHSETHQNLKYVVPLYLACLLVVCMACHGEVVERAPAAPYLTRFYLLIAFGGALGGVFVSVLSPMIFETYLELPVLLVLIAELMVLVHWQRRGAAMLLWPMRIVMIAAVVVLAGFLIASEHETRAYNVLNERSFYGVLRVRDYLEEEPAHRTLIHGTISHGHQYLADTHLDLPTSYYSERSGVGRAINVRARNGPIRVGVVGLGAGVLSSYASRGDYFAIYEINPDVIEIAESRFSFLARARERGAQIAVLLGDARLSLERQEPQRYDLLIVDAFSSDAIPTHLLTVEAFGTYFQHLKPEGVLAVHISNRYLDLSPVCQRAAELMQRSAMLVRDSGGELSDSSDWVLVTADRSLWNHELFADAHMEPIYVSASFAGWTDQYSSIWQVLSTQHYSVTPPDAASEQQISDQQDAP